MQYVRLGFVVVLLILGGVLGCNPDTFHPQELDVEIDTEFDASDAQATDIEVDIAEQLDEGLWPFQLPDCREQEPYRENATFAIPEESQPLQYSWETLQQRELPAKAYSFELAVIENGTHHNAFTQNGESFKLGANLKTSFPYDFDLRILVLRNYVPVETTISRASTGNTSTGFWHKAPMGDAESFEIVVPGVATPGVSEVEVLVWANPATNLAGGFRNVAKIAHYNEVVAPHPVPCLIPAAQGQFTEDELKYLVAPQTRLSVDHPDFLFPHWTNDFWPKLKIQRGESLDFLITSGRPVVPLRMGAQVMFVGEKVEWMESHGVELPMTPPETFVATFRQRKNIKFEQPGTYRFFAIQVADPFIPTHDAKNEKIAGYSLYSRDTSNVVEVIVE
jgi:hypothetical protein